MAGNTEDVMLDKQDFLEQQEVIKKQLLGNSKLTGAQKRACLQVLEGVGRSVALGGVRQHGITKAMLKTALPTALKIVIRLCSNVPGPRIPRSP